MYKDGTRRFFQRIELSGEAPEREPPHSLIAPMANSCKRKNRKARRILRRMGTAWRQGALRLRAHLAFLADGLLLVAQATFGSAVLAQPNKPAGRHGGEVTVAGPFLAAPARMLFIGSTTTGRPPSATTAQRWSFRCESLVRLREARQYLQSLDGRLCVCRNNQSDHGVVGTRSGEDRYCTSDMIRLTRSLIGGCVLKMLLDRSSNFLMGWTI